MTEPTVDPLVSPSELQNLGLFAASFGIASRVYHVGFVVPDLGEAIPTMAQVLGVPFTAPMGLPLPRLDTPDGPREVAIRYAYSTRPINVELIESVPGTLWDFDDRVRGHHLGVWAEDVAAESDRLESLGMPAAWWGSDDTSGRRIFSYHLTPFGFYIELVDSIAKSFYPEWFAMADPALAPPAKVADR